MSVAISTAVCRISGNSSRVPRSVPCHIRLRRGTFSCALLRRRLEAVCTACAATLRLRPLYTRFFQSKGQRGQEQLDTVRSLQGATMPDGSTHPSRPTLRFIAHWLPCEHAPRAGWGQAPSLLLKRSYSANRAASSARVRTPTPVAPFSWYDFLLSR